MLKLAKSIKLAFVVRSDLLPLQAGIHSVLDYFLVARAIKLYFSLVVSWQFGMTLSLRLPGLA